LHSLVKKTWYAAALAGFFIWQLLLANLRVAYDVITPRPRMKPGIVAIPLDIRSDIGITILANMITLTPGTLTMDISEDRRLLYIHEMYIDPKDLDSVRSRIKNGFEKRLLKVLE
jgi:multicomponent Na+:H+ antiporter subunit E